VLGPDYLIRVWRAMGQGKLPVLWLDGRAITIPRASSPHLRSITPSHRFIRLTPSRGSVRSRFKRGTYWSFAKPAGLAGAIGEDQDILGHVVPAASDPFCDLKRIHSDPESLTLWDATKSAHLNATSSRESRSCKEASTPVISCASHNKCRLRPSGFAIVKVNTRYISTIKCK